MKISQIAIRIPQQSTAISEIKELFGEEFYSDYLKMSGIMSGKQERDIQLNLSFNHTLMQNVELEFITSDSPRHWHQKIIGKKQADVFLSHLGVYCDSKEEMESICLKMFMAGFSVFQNTKSYNHTNKRVGDLETSSRCYQDVIFDSENRLGFNLKLSLKANLNDII